MSNVGSVLKRLRHQHSLTQAELAELIGVSYSSISMIELGKRTPSLEVLELLADHFNVSIDYLTGKDSKSIYYLDPETAKLAEELHNRSDLRALLDAGRKTKPEELRYLIKLLEGTND